MPDETAQVGGGRKRSARFFLSSLIPMIYSATRGING